MFYVYPSVCGSVGVADRNIMPDARLTASTFHSRLQYPYYARLNENRGRRAWCPKTSSDRTDYLQVDMGAVRFVCAVATQGERTGSNWATSYKVYLSTDGVTWNAYKEDNAEKVNKLMFSCLVAEFYRKLFFFFTVKAPLCRYPALYSV